MTVPPLTPNAGGAPALLSTFTPSLMPHATLEALLVGREELVTRLQAHVANSITSSARHNDLLIGTRGIGKTHLLTLLFHRIRATPELRPRCRIAWLKEEEWGISSFLDLLIRILKALAHGGASQEHALLLEAINQLYDTPPKSAVREAKALIKQTLNQQPLILLCENLDDIFAGLGVDGQKALRAWLQEEACTSICATATTLFAAISLRTSPCFGMFRVELLQEFSIEDARQLLMRAARLQGRADAADFLETGRGRARLRALHLLAGGNPRVYMIFSQFMTRESLEDLVQPIFKTLDDLTPYYQAKMKELSPQQRKLVEVLCDYRGRLPVKQAARLAHVTQQVASAQLGKLQNARHLVRSQKVGRESYYEIAEPLMRLCFEVKKHSEEPLRFFIGIAQTLYYRDELEAALERPALPPLELALISRVLRETSNEPLQDPKAIACLQAFEQARVVGDFIECLRAIEDLVAAAGQLPNPVLEATLRLALRLDGDDKALESELKAIFAKLVADGGIDSLVRVLIALAMQYSFSQFAQMAALNADLEVWAALPEPGHRAFSGHFLSWIAHANLRTGNDETAQKIALHMLRADELPCVAHGVLSVVAASRSQLLTASQHLKDAVATWQESTEADQFWSSPEMVTWVIATLAFTALRENSPDGLPGTCLRVFAGSAARTLALAVTTIEMARNAQSLGTAPAIAAWNHCLQIDPQFAKVGRLAAAVLAHTTGAAVEPLALSQEERALVEAVVAARPMPVRTTKFPKC